MSAQRLTMPGGGEFGPLKRSNPTPILTILEFVGPERICWECGGIRCLMISHNLDGEDMDVEEFCDKEGFFP